MAVIIRPDWPNERGPAHLPPRRKKAVLVFALRHKAPIVGLQAWVLLDNPTGIGAIVPLRREMGLPRETAADDRRSLVVDAEDAAVGVVARALVAVQGVAVLAVVPEEAHRAVQGLAGLLYYRHQDEQLVPGGAADVSAGSWLARSGLTTYLSNLCLRILLRISLAARSQSSAERFES